MRLQSKTTANCLLFNKKIFTIFELKNKILLLIDELVSKSQMHVESKNMIPCLHASNTAKNFKLKVHIDSWKWNYWRNVKRVVDYLTYPLNLIQDFYESKDLVYSFKVYLRIWTVH